MIPIAENVAFYRRGGNLSKSSSLFLFSGNCKFCGIDFFQLQQIQLFVDPARIACQASSASDNPVAWDQNRNRIMSDRAAYRLRRHGFDLIPCGNLTRDGSVGCNRTVWNLLQNFPHGKTEGRAHRAQRRRKIWNFSLKIEIKPFFCQPKYRQLLFRPFRRKRSGVIFLSVKPQAGQSLFGSR